MAQIDLPQGDRHLRQAGGGGLLHVPAPRTSASSRATARAAASIRSRSLPTTLTTTGAVKPEMTSSIRSVRNDFSEKAGREARDQVADAPLDPALRRPAEAGFEVDVDLAVMRPGGVLAGLGPADLRGDRAHAGNGLQVGGDEGAEPLRFRQRRAGRGHHVEDQVPLPQVGQEGQAEAGHQRRPGERGDDPEGDHRPRRAAGGAGSSAR